MSEKAKAILKRLKQDARDIRKGYYRPQKVVATKDGPSHTTYRLLDRSET